MGDTYTVERTKTMQAPPGKVFEKVVDLREWSDWSPWEEMDPNMQKTFTGDPGTVGSGYSWTGNRKVGEGSMTITDVDTPTKVALDLKFIKPFKSENVTELWVAPSGDGSQVTWRMTGQQTLMLKIMGIFKSMDKMVGPDFEKGLSSLKGLVEAD